MTATHTIIDSPVGPLTIVAEYGVLAGIYFPGHWTLPNPATFGARQDTGFDAVTEQLEEYFAGERSTFDLPTVTRGDEWSESVWALLREIPYGETVTYGDLALELGAPLGAARAVGRSVGHNPISIVVPCHRVVGKNGSLTGFGGGLERKRKLLELEGAAVVAPSLF